MYVGGWMDEWMNGTSSRGGPIHSAQGMDSFPLTSFLFFCSLVAEDNTH